MRIAKSITTFDCENCKKVFDIQDEKNPILLKDEAYCCFECLSYKVFGKHPDEIRHLIHIQNG